jgi:hypothetical protein
VKKSDKIALWKDLEEMLPPVASRESGKDPVGLISLVDRAYVRAYKLHRVYSSAMRLHCAARWVGILQRALGQNRKEGWRKILRCLVKSETGTYRLEHDKITLVARGKKVKDDTIKRPSLIEFQSKPTTPTLFDKTPSAESSQHLQ